MKTLYEPQEHSQVHLKVTVDGEQWELATKKAFKKISNNVQIKGFRKGHAPAHLVKSQVSQQEIWYEAIDGCAQEALNYGLEQYPDLRLVDRPSLDVETVNETEATLVFILTVYPEVKLGDYKSLEYEVARVSVLKKDVEKEIENLRQQQSSEVLKEDGKVAQGDIAVIDFEGFKDGVPFDGGKGTEYPLEIGSGTFIPGFESQVIGMETDEEKDIEVTFPENYGAADLAGAPVVFHVKVDAIKTKQLPELNDEFVQELAIADGVETVEQLQKHLKEQLTTQRKAEAEEKATNNLLDSLLTVAEFEIPAKMIEDEIEDTFNSYVNRIQQQGLTLDLYYQLTGTNETSFKEQLAPEAEKKLKIRLILGAVAKDLGIEVSEQEIEEEYGAMAEQYQMEVEQIKSIIPAEYLKDDLVIRKALEELKKITAKKKTTKKAEGVTEAD